MRADLRTAELVDWLQAQRRHVLGVLEGLDEEQLRRPVLPSGWSCLGLLQHLAWDDERFWFQAVVAGQQDVIDALAGAGDSWQVGPGVTAAEVFADYREQSRRTDEIIAATPGDQAPAWWPDFFGDYRLKDLHGLLLHVVVEYATHAGHLDAARELIDGKQWLVLD